MARTDPQVSIRLPEKLNERLRASASVNRRTLTGEIIVLLERALGTENNKAEAAGTASA